MRLRRVALAGAAALVALVAFAGPAAAHATLEESTPSNGSRVERAPSRILLKFSERVEVALGGVRVFDAAGKRVDHGSITHPNGVASEVGLGLPKLRDGGYVVTWRVISADSHPVQGAFTFTVGNAAPAKASQVADLVANSGGSRAVGVSYGIGRGVAFAALLLLVGSVAFVCFVWPAGATHPRVRRITIGALVVLAVASVANLALQGGYAAGLTLGGSLKPSVVGDVLRTRFGHVYELRLALLAALAALLALLRRRPALKWAALFVGVGVAATPGLAGHAAQGSNEPYALIADVVHVSAAAAWIGGLVVLLAVVLPTVDFDESTAVVRGFSRNAAYAVTVIVATGVFQAWRQIGTLQALRSTEYGKLVIVKTVLVAAVVCIAFASRSIVQQRWSPATASTLRRTVTLEAVVAVGVLVVTSLLVNAVPAKTQVARPQSGELVGKAMLLDFTASPAKVGPNEIHLYALTKTGQPENIVEMKLTLALPGRGIAPIDVPLQNAGPGHFQSLDFEVPFSGRWTMQVTARTSEIDEEILSGSVEFR